MCMVSSECTRAVVKAGLTGSALKAFIKLQGYLNTNVTRDLSDHYSQCWPWQHAKEHAYGYIIEAHDPIRKSGTCQIGSLTHWLGQKEGVSYD